MQERYSDDPLSIFREAFLSVAGRIGSYFFTLWLAFWIGHWAWTGNWSLASFVEFPWQFLVPAIWFLSFLAGLAQVLGFFLPFCGFLAVRGQESAKGQLLSR